MAERVLTRLILLGLVVFLFVLFVLGHVER